MVGGGYTTDPGGPRWKPAGGVPMFPSYHPSRWNPAAEYQAIDRAHRLGQHKPIRAVRFVVRNTVEERILRLQDKKRLVFEGTVRCRKYSHS